MIRGSDLQAEVTKYLAGRAGGWRVDLERLENNAPPLPTLRRSARVPVAERERVERERLLSFLSVQDDARHGLTIANYGQKGRGIKAVKSFSKGDFVVEYSGELLDIGTAKDLESKYSQDPSKGSYMLYFKHKGKQYW